MNELFYCKKGFDMSNGPDFPLDPSDLLPEVLVPEDLK